MAHAGERPTRTMAAAIMTNAQRARPQPLVRCRVDGRRKTIARDRRYSTNSRATRPHRPAGASRRTNAPACSRSARDVVSGIVPIHGAAFHDHHNLTIEAACTAQSGTVHAASVIAMAGQDVFIAISPSVLKIDTATPCLASPRRLSARTTIRAPVPAEWSRRSTSGRKTRSADSARRTA